MAEEVQVTIPDVGDPFEATALIEMENIAEKLDDEDLKEIGCDVVEGYDRDELSRNEWLERYRDWIALAMQTVEQKNYPWPKASNVKYPLLTQGAISFQARIGPALLQGPKIVKGRVVGKDETGQKQESAVRVETHMSYQVLEQMTEWETGMDRLTLVLPIVGCAFKKSYFSSLLRRNVSSLILPHDLCVDYYAEDLESARRVTHVMEMSRNDLYERTAAKTFLDVDLGATTQMSTARRRIHESKDETGKTKEPSGEDEKNIPRIILEQHTWLDLDEDGYEEPYIVTVDYQTKQVLRITARYEADGVEYTADGDILRIAPVNYFTKYEFIPAPDGGFYGVGFGLLLGPLNNTVNTLINLLIDAGTLSNMQSGFIARGIRVQGGKKRFSPGEWKTAAVSGAKLKDGIVPLPVKEPSNTLYMLLGLLLESGEKLASIIDSLTGENPGQNQKATTTLAVIEQGLKVFSGIQKRVYRAMHEEFKKLHRLNAIYLEPTEYYRVLDDPKAAQQEVYKTDYRGDWTDVIPYADPNVSSEAQRLMKAQALIELLDRGFKLNPEVVQRRVLEAMSIPGIDELMNVPEAPPSVDQRKQDLAEAEFKHKVELDHEELKLREREVQASENQQQASALLTTIQAQTEAGATRMAEIESMLKVIVEFNTHQRELEKLRGENDRQSQETNSAAG